MSMNYKGDLLELIQSRVLSVADNIEFITPQQVAPFVSTIVMKNICPGMEFEGMRCSSKKEAEKSAAQRIMEDKALVNHIRRYESRELLSPSYQVNQEENLAKGRLLEMFQKKGLPLDMVIFTTPQFASPFQCTITIPDIFPQQEFVGYPSRTKKEAEKSASLIILNDLRFVDHIWKWMPPTIRGGNGNVSSTIESDAPVLAKGKLLEILQKKGIPTNAMQWDCSTLGNLFQCAISLPEVFGHEKFVGGYFTTKKEAEKSAAQVLLMNANAMSQLCHWTPPHSVVKQEFDVSPMGISMAEAKGRLLEMLQKKGYPVSSAVFSVRQDLTGLFVCFLRVDCVMPGVEFVGQLCTTKKEAEKSAAYMFLQDSRAMRAFSDIENFSRTPQSFMNVNVFGI